MMDAAPQPEQPDPGRAALADALQVSFRLLRMAMLFIAIAYLFSGVFIVREHERAYVLVFGKIAGLGTERVKEPGLHWTWPKPVAEIVRVPAERIQTLEIDTAWPATNDTRAPLPALRPLQDGYLLTGDANIVHARWAIRYTVRDPARFLFDIRDARQLLQMELERAATRVTQQWAVDAVLRTDIEGFRSAVAHVLRQRLQTYPTGIELHRLDLLAVAPPLQVAPAFAAVIEAEQDRSRVVSAARAYAARTLNETRGEQSRLLADARADRQRIISEAEADAQLFTSVLPPFQAQPHVLTHTLWQDRIRTILTRVDRHYFLYERADGKRELRLMIGR
jgi:modulator of FtsH protease HflK